MDYMYIEVLVSLMYGELLTSGQSFYLGNFEIP